MSSCSHSAFQTDTARVENLQCLRGVCRLYFVEKCIVSADHFTCCRVGSKLVSQDLICSPTTRGICGRRLAEKEIHILGSAYRQLHLLGYGFILLRQNNAVPHSSSTTL